MQHLLPLACRLETVKPGGVWQQQIVRRRNFQDHPLHFKTGQDGGLAPTSTATVGVDATEDASSTSTSRPASSPLRWSDLGGCDLPLVWERSYDRGVAALLAFCVLRHNNAGGGVSR